MSTQEDTREFGTGRPSPGAVRVLTKFVRPVVSLLFRPTLDGLEHLPRERPFLLVANHSAGIGIAELTSFASLYAEQAGPERPLAGFAHPIGFRFWPVTAIHRALGSVPSTYDGAYDALDRGVPLLVFPGGDHETMRPIWQAGEVDFARRKGFLRIAREAGVPIVPMGIRGSHTTAPILWRSKLLAKVLALPRLLGLKRWCVSLLGVIGAAAIAMTPLPWFVRLGLVWLWLTSPLIFLPIVPSTIEMQVGQPIEPEELFEDRGSDDETLEAALESVTSRVQSLVDG